MHLNINSYIDFYIFIIILLFILFNLFLIFEREIYI